jgi:hypothetical protein
MVKIHFLFSFLFYFLLARRDCLLGGDSIPRRFRCKEKSSTFFRAVKIDLTNALGRLHPKRSALKVNIALKPVPGGINRDFVFLRKQIRIHPTIGNKVISLVAAAFHIDGLPRLIYIGRSHGVS